MAEQLLPTEGAISYFNQTNLMTALFWFLFIVGITFILVFVGFGIWYLTYRVKVRYYQVIGKTLDNREMLRFIGTDKGKLIKERGNIYKLRFFWKRRKIEPPSSEAYLSTRKGYEMHIKTDGINFNPMVLTANPGFAEVPMHKRLWLIQTQKQALEQYSKPSFWDRYGTLIMTGGTIMLCLIAMGFTVWYTYKLGAFAITQYSSAIVQAGNSAVAPGA